MPTFTEVLPATRSEKHRGYFWTPCGADAGCPCSGSLEVTKGKKSTSYALTEFLPSPGYSAGRAFELVKADGTVYHLYLADDRGRSTCDCAGFSYDATRKADRRHGQRTESLGCVHLDAVDSIAWNCWLPESRTNAEADTGPTEAPEMADDAIPECFRTGFGTGAGCPF